MHLEEVQIQAVPLERFDPLIGPEAAARLHAGADRAREALRGRTLFNVNSTALGKLSILGLAVGFYDGAWGPGGGTFMFLGLLFGAKIPLLPAIATSKLANSVSAFSSLANYWRQDLVSPIHGAAVAVGSMLGATQGARLAHQHADRLVRPALVVIALLLLIRVFST
jgi:uncharacterized membrane protein YfcA